MLPHALCNHLCSLNPNETKLSFSCMFCVDKHGELIKDGKHQPYFRKTIMTTCCRLNYDEVQEIYDGLEPSEGYPPVYIGAKWEDIEKDLFTILRVCTKIREARFRNGAMAMQKVKMVFHTKDGTDGVPTGYHYEHNSASHWVIEELMLLANQCVGRHEQVNEVLGDLAILRNHPPPDP